MSSQLSLLRRGGSEVDLGNLLSLPFNGGLLYVEPVYIRATTDGYPLLRKVLVGYGSNVAFEDTLSAALYKVFDSSPIATVDPVPDDGSGGTVTPTPTPAPTTPSSGDPATDLAFAIADAQAAYEAGQRALVTGDFTAYDVAQKKLAAALQRAADAQALLSGAPPADTAAPADNSAA